MKFKIKTVKQFETSTGKIVGTLDEWKREELDSILGVDALDSTPRKLIENATAVISVLKVGTGAPRGPKKKVATAAPSTPTV